jgi:hypothetical protein
MYIIYNTPSVYAHVINGLLLLIAFIISFRNYSQIRNLEPYKLIIIVLIFSIGVGVHGLSHLGLEKVYNYNPLHLYSFKTLIKKN